MIGLVIPGQQVISGGSIYNNNFVMDIYNPRLINNVSLFLTELIPEDTCASLYFSVPPYENLQFLGCVANLRPSDIFYTGWVMNPQVNTLEQIKICVKLDKIEDIKTAHLDKIKSDMNQEFARRVAKNLYNYLDSFNENQDPNKKVLVVPLNSLETWYEKFNLKYKMDPNFLMKTDL